MRWIIGDVHGMLIPLRAVLEGVSRVDPEPTYYFVGDYVNRGGDSRGVIDLLLTLRNARFVRGNHDDVLDQVLHGVAYAENASHGDRFLAFQWFLEHGLLETLQSYGVTMPMIGRVVVERNAAAMQPVIEAFPATHREFIRMLPVYLEDEDLFIVHGKWPVRERRTPKTVLGVTMPPGGLRHEILWGRFSEAELSRKQSWPKRGIFGHTPVPTYPNHQDDYTPIVSGRLTLLDTAAALSPVGRLTALCADRAQMVQADPQGKLIVTGSV